MINLTNLTCPSCGSPLQVGKDLSRFTCGFCGNEIIAERSGGAISYKSVEEGIQGVKHGVDKTASELAIVRLKEEIKDITRNRENMRENIQAQMRAEIADLASKKENRPLGCSYVLVTVLFILSSIPVFAFWGDGNISLISGIICGFFLVCMILMSIRMRIEIRNSEEMIEKMILDCKEKFAQMEKTSIPPFDAEIRKRMVEIENHKLLLTKE